MNNTSYYCKHMRTSNIMTSKFPQVNCRDVPSSQHGLYGGRDRDTAALVLPQQ